MTLGKFLAIILSAASSLLLDAQEKETADSLVRLVDARSAQLLEIGGQSYRKVVGPARFLHNDTYLLCDTALWNVDTRIIDAIGHVSIIQEGTVLESDKMVYIIDSNLAEFRGSLVELRDSDHNTLRTHYLDYNTKDSVAVFRNGGAMRDKDGQIIESLYGTYDSKIGTFTFRDNVNMFTDSIFVRTSSLKYESERSLATFGSRTDAWKDDNMLSADAGWYDRARELFLFRNNVHVMTDTQEGWSDSLYFNRNTVDVEMLGNVQVTDTSRNVSAVAGRIHYMDSLSKVTMTRKPAVVSEIQEGETRDTVWFGADFLVYHTVPRYLVDSSVVAASQQRLSDLNVDPVTTYRRKSREEAEKAAAEAAKSDPNNKAAAEARREEMARKSAGVPKGGAVPDAASSVKDTASLPQAADSSVFKTDSLAVMADSLGMVQDSLGVSADSVEVLPPDTTKIGFLSALGNVRIFRKSMQVVCDSLEYTDLDSLARLFKEPAIWNGVTHQYAADSITAVISNGAMEKASLMSEAFIHIQEDTLHYDQIKSTEMIAYFDGAGELSRFDALGGASALFYIEEQETLATVNKKEAKMLSAVFRDGTIHRIYYFDTVKSDAYPVVQLMPEDRLLKGFRWSPERRPKDRYAVTSWELRSPERRKYAARPRAEYVQTEKYFPGYIGDIYRQIEVRDSLSVLRAREEREEKLRAEREERFREDSLSAAREIAVKDSLAAVKFRNDSIAAADSLNAIRDSVARADSIAVADSIAASRIPTKEEIRAKKKEERLKRHQARVQAKADRWARKDEQDRMREEAIRERKQAKIREKKLKTLQQAAEQAARDNELLEKYKKKAAAREAAKAARKAAGSGGRKSSAGQMTEGVIPESVLPQTGK